MRALAVVVAVAVTLPLRATFAYAAAPAVSAVTPSAAHRGAAVTVTGSGLTGATGVAFNGVPAAFSVLSDTRIDATVPSAATTGPVSVTTPEGTATSAEAFTVTPPIATTLRLWVGPSTVAYGGAVTIAAGLTRSDGSGVGGEPVRVYVRPRGSTGAYTLLAGLTTASNGSASMRHVPRANVEYTLRHPASHAYQASASGVAPVGVRPRLGIRLQPGGTVEQYANVAVDGLLTPAHAGQHVVLQRYAPDGTWRSVASTGLTTEGRYVFRFRATALGGFAYRVTKAADSDHLAATSAIVRLSVLRRTLREGMSGPDVVSLQQRLAALKMDVGAVNGYFGYDTRHAVVAFQKYAGLARTGVVDAGVRARLDAAGLPRVAFPRAGLSVEIDLTRQILVLGRDGHVVRVIDVSTGNNQPYYDQGVRYIAYTPLGSFRVERKIDGVRVSRLGELYRPAYFHQGWAIHGSASVPTYPASHGCVRVTNPAMDRLFPILPIGTPVRVYRS